MNHESEFKAVVRHQTGGSRIPRKVLMVRDMDAEAYTEHHTEGVLEYRFEPKLGIPFPTFVAASGEFPELQVEAQWEHGGKRGRAVIENGRLVEKS
jgi:hypothetical protein